MSSFLSMHARLTSDFVDYKVHLAVGPLAQLTDDLIVSVDLQLLHILGSNELQLLQDVDGAA